VAVILWPCQRVALAWCIQGRGSMCRAVADGFAVAKVHGYDDSLNHFGLIRLSERKPRSDVTIPPKMEFFKVYIRSIEQVSDEQREPRLTPYYIATSESDPSVYSGLDGRQHW
jgi:hypothetical protein